MQPAKAVERQHLLTISLEDYFQVRTFRNIIQHRHWNRFEMRLERNVSRVLSLLERFDVKATFFVLGWIADRHPDIVREVARKGHEIASKGYYPRSFREMLPDELRENMRRARTALEKASGREVIGCRIPQQSFGPSDLWALDVLAQEGYRYDSSMVPLLRSFSKEPWRRFAHQHHHDGRILWEFPISTYNVLGLNVPISGGNYLRQLPRNLTHVLTSHWAKTYDAPFLMYFHVWELDNDQVRIEAASRLTRIRQYRNLQKMPAIIEEYLSTFRFTSIANYLGLDTSVCPEREPEPVAIVARAAATPRFAASGDRLRTPVTIVIPCYNEELVLPYLDGTVRTLEAALDEFDLHFVCVDDASSDGTYDSLQRLFGSRDNCKVVRHARNQGVAGAILTGIENSATEIVCSIDCDCSYDPMHLRAMIPMLTEDVDVVTASPYHPEGHVQNVPGWRLLLSKASSLLYRCVLKQKLHTYTSCCRVYRRSQLAGLEISNRGFIGVAEILGRLDLAGARIVEHPATLEVRLMGRSKMKVIRAITAHLILLGKLWGARHFGRHTSVRSAASTRDVPLTTNKATTK